MSQFISMKMVGLDNVTRRITKILPQEVEKQLAADVKVSATEVATAFTALMPRLTGATSAQLKIKTSNKGLTAKIGVFGDRGFIARLLNFGTKPHRIFARAGGALALANGLFAPEVMHPGIKPANFLQATQAMRDRFQSRFGDGLRDAVQRAAEQ